MSPSLQLGPTCTPCPQGPQDQSKARLAATHLRATCVRVSLLILSLTVLSWAADGGRAQRRRRARCRAASICGDDSAVSWGHGWGSDEGGELRHSGQAQGAAALFVPPGAGDRDTLCGSPTPGWRAVGHAQCFPGPGQLCGQSHCAEAGLEPLDNSLGQVLGTPTESGTLRPGKSQMQNPRSGTLPP